MIWPIPNFMAWTALAVGLAVGAGVQQIRVNNAKAELAQVREQHAQAVADAALARTHQFGLVPLTWALSCLLSDIGSAEHSPDEMVQMRDNAAATVRNRGGRWAG